MKLKKQPAREGQDAAYMFYCPACKFYHVYEVPRWQKSGTDEQPTFTPSLSVKFGTNFENHCHLFVTAGVIEYQGDCTHSMAGKKVPLPEYWDDYGLVREEFFKDADSDSHFV